MARPDPKDLIPSGPWPRGANNVAREDSVPRGALREAVNVDFYPGGKSRRRGGSERVLSQSSAHSAWSDGHFAMYAAGGTLYRFVPGATPLALSPIRLGADLAYAAVNQYVYVSDGVQALRVSTLDNSVVSWGVATPLGLPTLTANAAGGMNAGTYQLTITFARADGEESAAPPSAAVDVVAGGGITLTHFPPVPSDVATINVYLTTADGTDEALISVLPANVTTAQVLSPTYGRPLKTQLMSPMPPGSDAVFTNGRLYVAFQNFVCWSEPLRFGLYQPEFNYVALPEPIALLVATSPAAQSQGVFVATASKTYFLAGTDPGKTSSVSTAYSGGAVPGSKVVVSGSYFEDEHIPNVPVPVWVSTLGTVCVGLPDGSVYPLTEGRFAMAIGDRGAAVVRELNGIRQLLFSMRPPVVSSRLVAVDSLTVTRVKNGIVIQ